MRVVAVYSGKGGVGKTTTAVNLAYLSASAGIRTLLWDLDPQAAATYLFRVKPKVAGGSSAVVGRDTVVAEAVKGTDYDYLDLMPADATYRHMDLDLAETRRPTRRLRRVLTSVADEYDLVVLDTPPSVSLVSENLLHAADLVLVPMVPAVLAVRAFEQFSELVEQMDGRHRPRAHAFFTMIDRRRALHRDIVARLSAERADVAATAIPALPVIEQMPVRREPVVAFASSGPAAQAYRTLWAEVLPLLELAGSPARG